VISRLRQAFQMDISLRIMFDHPSVSGLASYIDGILFSESGEP